MTSFFGSRKWKRFSQFLYSWGASIVILGALFKLTHFSIGFLTGETMLWVGLLTEAFIFFISAFESPHKEYDWSLVYPELVGIGEETTDERKVRKDGLARLNDIFAGADIDGDVMAKLGTGIHKLEHTASQLNDISQASVATNDYVENLNNATRSVRALADSNDLNVEAYRKVSASLAESVTRMESNSNNYNSQMSVFNNNLSSLNSIYELQLKATKERLYKQEQVQESMGEVMSNLATSLEKSKNFKQQTEELAQNLDSLNKVYGNMLSAMNVSK